MELTVLAPPKLSLFTFFFSFVTPEHWISMSFMASWWHPQHPQRAGQKPEVLGRSFSSSLILFYENILCVWLSDISCFQPASVHLIQADTMRLAYLMSRASTGTLLKSPFLPTFFLLFLLPRPGENGLEARHAFKTFRLKTQLCLDQFLSILHC